MKGKSGQINPILLSTLGGFALGYSFGGLTGGLIGALIGFFILKFV
jgi:hypothetical protein